MTSTAPVRGRHHALRAASRPAGRPTWLAVPLALAVAGVSATGFGVYAALNATAYNASAMSTGSGTLKLTLADNGNGFTQAISAMAPGDVVDRYVDLSASGTIDGRSLSLAVADANSTKLTTDATNGLHATITACTGGTWTPGTGVCSGSTSVLASNASLASMISTPTTLVSGAVTSGTTWHLQVAVALPDQVETTVNGVLPSNTIQGLTAALTWTFSDVQRAGTTTTG